MAAEHLTKLYESLFEEKLSGSDFCRSLGSHSSLKQGLQAFYLLLKRPVPSFTHVQIHSLLSLALRIVSTFRSLPVEQADTIVVAVFQELVEFCVSFLELNSPHTTYDNSHIQGNMVSLMELALVEKTEKLSTLQDACSISSLVELLPVVSGGCLDINLDNHKRCRLRGAGCSRGEKPADQLVMTLASECMQPQWQPSVFVDKTKDLNSLGFFSLHWAVVHVNCIQRLMACCRKLIELPDSFDEKIASPDFCQRLLSSLRILNLLQNIVEHIPYVDYEASMLQEIASCADAIPRLFRLGFEFGNCTPAAEGSLESLMLLLLEDFLHLVQVIFCSSCASLNIQAFVVASIIENFDSSIWRYNKSVANPKPPVVYFPRTVLYLLKLVQDLKRQGSRPFSLKEFDKDLIDRVTVVSDDCTSCHVHCQKVSFLKRHSIEELLQMIFAPQSKWMDNIIHLTFFLHSEGEKLRPKVERVHSSSSKGNSSELENAVFHEDEALFGNLFSEGSRSMGTTDGSEQPVAVNSSTSTCNMPMQAAAETLIFLKECVFSEEWSHFLFADACKSLKKSHIDRLLSILNCQGCYLEGRSSCSCAVSQEEKKIGHIHELCFELFHCLLTRYALSDALEDYLVERILGVENDVFVCNDQTLTLIAHSLLSRAGLAGNKLRIKLYTIFVSFIVAKIKVISVKCPPCKDVVESLPSVFHMEVLLMAFHLSTEGEKATLANMILSALQSIDSPSVNAHLSCWALLVSRLILLLRHMMLYPHACPSSLLVDVRSKLREAPICSLQSGSVSYQVLSVASSVVKKICVCVEEEPPLAALMNQLIEVSAIPPLCRDELAIEFLHLTWSDISVTFSWVLGFWRGKRPSAVEDLIIERYIFCLCSDLLLMNSPDGQLSLWSDPLLPETSNILYFFRFSRLLMGHCDVSKGTSVAELVLGVLKHLCSSNVPEDVKELGWDFLRDGLWLSPVISLFNVGICSYCIKKSVPGVSSFWIENTADDNQYVSAAEALISILIEAGEASSLLSVLSTLLDRYIRTFQKSFLSTLCSVHDDANMLSSLLLLKHSGFDKCLLEELINEHAIGFNHLEFLFDLLSKIDDILDKRASGIRSKVFWQFIFHGFPSNNRTASATLVSCILSIQGIVIFLDRLFMLADLRKSFSVHIEVLAQILNSVMIIKFDRIFESLQGKCEAIIGNIGAGPELSDYSDLFLMKQFEGILREIITREESKSRVLEWVITEAISTADRLRKDPMRFKFYLAVEDVPKQIKNLYESQRGDLVVLIDCLNNCFSEAVNGKVLNFFVDLLSGEFSTYFKQKIQKKFLEMDLLHLSKWLEKRLLGCILESSSGQNCAKGNSASLRETTMSFILSLMSMPSELQSEELHNHLFEAVLTSLDAAFLLFDIHIAKSYFSFLVQLSKDVYSMRLLLQRTMLLMENLASDEHFLPGLKVLFGFLGTILSDCGSCKFMPENLSGKFSSGSNSLLGCVALQPDGSGKNSDTLVISANQGGSRSLECDATSVDEDEDDGTSDGDVASIDKDEDEDMTSERTLASKVCTFTSSGSNFMEQHWYFCYTCDLTVSKGCCSVCAKVCHRGHRVVYSRSSRFFCDCGAGGVRGSTCQCLKPRKFTESDSVPIRSVSNLHSILPYTEDADQLPESDSDLGDDCYADADSTLGLSIPRELREEIPRLLKELHVEGRVLQLCSSFLPSITCKREYNVSKDKDIILGEDKILSYGVELLQLKKAYKSGSLDLKIKAEYSNAKELRSHLASGSLVKSLLSVSNRGRLAVGEGDRVGIFDVGQLIVQATIAPITADKTNVKPLSRNVVRFEIVHLAFNSVVENYLAVAGYEDCQVLTLNPRGDVTDRLAIELALQGAYIRRIDWVPGSQVKLMVVTNRFIKTYDLSQDNISPLHYLTLPEGMIVDATMFMASQGRMLLLVLSEQGNLYRIELSLEGNVGATPLTEIIQIKDREIKAKGSSLYYSSTYKILFLSYQDCTTLMGRLNADATAISELCILYEDEQNGQRRSASLHRWKELLVGSGLFVCFSNLKANAAVTLSIGANELHAQILRHAASSSSNLVGITAYKPLSKDKVHCLVLHDDGSLQIYSHISAGADSGASVTAEKIKKLGSEILNSKAYAGIKPEFPLDFFEKTVCITADVKLGGDAIRNGDSEAAKQTLASEDGFLESPSPAGFKISVFNSNPDIVMVGFRVHVGNTSAGHIPSDITIFQRLVKLDEGMRSWYDIPFTVAESLLADEEFIISVGPTFNGTALPRIDSLEVYGRAKDEFGWKEKMDAVLDMEARMLGSSSLLTGPRKKNRSMQSTSIQEQVVADGLKLLSRFYFLCRAQEDNAAVELSELKGKALLETIFESDREPLLQAAACHVLHSIFLKKDVYYQVKDTMRLCGVVKSTSHLSSRLGICESAQGWIIEEFTAQMCAVSKIALHRRSNLAGFLEMNGSEVVDGLMQVLWGILDLEWPDTQTMNNIVIASVELIYCYAECLALHGKDVMKCSVSPAVVLFKKLLFSSNDAVQTSSSLAISSRLLQVPFPNQTILATDDTGDGAVSVSGPTESAGGSTQVMIEEDSITSSVHYCCDGCSTVPILRRRWHCTVCPDFDLCEACYQVLDAERLPPPHSRDHPMMAIPIEVESLGGDDNEIRFPMDDGHDTSLLPVTSDISTQDRASIHVLEPNESGEFSASVIDSVSISDSKRAVNSLLLIELLDQLKGWMVTTPGVRAIPVMQLFYRLSSAVGGPFIDSSKSETLDLEKLIKWFLDEIDLSKPFVVRTRSSFGEVTILVFMFFTLMLRNWHQPGSDSSIPKSCGNAEMHDRNLNQAASVGSQSSLDIQERNDFITQLHRACSLLRNQAFVNYLMDILQQLVHVFKSSTGNLETAHGLNTGSGCGALLTIRRDLPAGNFSPFFSDSYAKAHRSDIFIDYHRLLLENAFRLLYTLVRPEKLEKTGEKEKVYKSSCKDLKLDGHQDVLCSYINNPHTTFVRRYARRLFLHLCGSKTHYYSVRDSWQFSSEIKKLYKHINKSGGLQNPVPYERSVKIVKCLCTMAEVAVSRPRNWQKYCLRHGDVLPFLMNGVFHFGEESVIQALKLLNLAFYTGKDVSRTMQRVEADDLGAGSKSGVQSVDSKKKKKSEDEMGLEKSYLDMEAVVDILTDKGNDVLRQFVDCFLLEWNLSAVRMEAKCVLYGAWHHGKQSFKETLLTVLLQKVKSLPSYGQNIVEFTELVTWLLGKAPDSSYSRQQSTELVDRCLNPEIIRCIFDVLHSQNELIANHPNSRIYNTLSGLVEFDGYYLESEPCVACSSPEVPYSRMKLESLKSETKFTDNRIIVKCTGSYTIQTVTMNVHDSRKSKSVKVLNLYYNNRPVSDLSELKNNWSLWKRAKSCHLAFNQTDLKVEFPIPITACNFMIELDSFYENLQALSLEPLQCPRCSRPVTDKHGICSNCHENAYQCRQCRNINYENLDSFLCNECGFSKYGRFEFNFMAKPSFTFDNMENDEDMKRGLAAIEAESENAHRRYQQLLGFKKPLLKIVSSIGENEMDSQQKDSVQQMMISLPGPSCKINRKIALLGVLYGEKCKAAFDSVSKSVQTLQGLRRVLMYYLHQKHSDDAIAASRFVVSRSPNNCYGCATTFVTQCLDILQVLSKHPNLKKLLVAAGILSELFENNIHQGPKTARVQARAVLCAFSEGDINAVTELNNLIQKKVMYCLEHHRSMDVALATREELLLLSEVCSLTDEFWESRLRVVFQLLFSSIKLGAKHPAIAEHIILPCLRIVSQACAPPKPDTVAKDQGTGKSSSTPQLKDENNNKSGSVSGPVGNKIVAESSEKSWESSNKTQDIQLLSYSEWERGASYLDFVRRQYKVSQAVKGTGQKSRTQRHDYMALKYALRWKRYACKTSKGDLTAFELGSWVTELVLSACSQSIRSEMCMLINLLCAHSSSRRFRLLNLLMALLPATIAVGDSAAEYFELLFKMIESEDARLFLTVRGCLTIICKLITQEVNNVESLERSLQIDISQGFILHKLIELLGKFLEVPNIRSRFMQESLLSNVLEALIVICGLIVQKTKLISDCNNLLKDLLDSLLLESSENKRQFIRACICGLQKHGEERKGRTCLFILEQLCNLISPSKPESVYLLILNKAHTQEEFIRGSMTKNPYSSAEIGPLMRDVKNKICHQLDLLGLLEDDYGMELLVAGNIISLDLSIAQVYEQVWKKSSSHSSAISNSTLLSSATNSKDCVPMTVTYRLQGLDGEATEPMIKELEEDREESQDPEIEFAIAGAVREYGGLEILLGMIKQLRDDFKSNQEQLVAVLNLLMLCCKIRDNRRALLKLGALGLLLETARRAFSVDAMEPAEGILLIVESLTLEANESDNISITQSALTVTSEETGTGEQAKKIVLMFLERMCHPSGLKKSHKQQRNTEMVARILPYLTYGEPTAMEALIEHFNPFLLDWGEFDQLQKRHLDDLNDENIAEEAAKQRFTVENFVRVSESLKTSSCGERLKDIILEKGITDVAIRHLKDRFAVTGQAGFRSSAEWLSGLKLPSLPYILSMLRGLSTGHLATQRCIDERGILPLLHALEGVPGENEIGARAENLLDTLSNKEGKGDGFLAEKVNNLRHTTRDEMRRRALRKREELLQGLGMRQEMASDGGERIVVSQPILEGLEDVEEEEDGLACMVCREGYSLRPNDLLGVYSYSKRVNLGVGTSGSARGECVYTTVSYFNIIHFQCHQEAKRADAALRNPKKEWEGATLRNNESFCNSLFPVRGPSVPLSQYVRYVDLYWDNLNALGRADGSRLRLLIYDIVLMLARFATGASFSAESRGGGGESNSRFLPFMIQMACYLLDQGSPSHRRSMAKAVSSYISSSLDSGTSTPVSQSAMGTEETVQFMMVNSLLSESYESWLQHRRAFLQRGIYHAFMQHIHGRPASRAFSSTSNILRIESGGTSGGTTSEAGSSDELLVIIRPMLVYTGLIEQLQRLLKVRNSTSGASTRAGGNSAGSEGDDESASREGWEVVMKERLLNVSEMVAFSKESLSWLDEMKSATDMQEAFDIVGVLPDVLSGGITKCEDFVRTAINSAKTPN